MMRRTVRVAGCSAAVRAQAVLLGLVLAAATATAQAPRNVSGGPLRPAQACIDVCHLDLALRVDPGERHIDGELTMTAAVVVDTREVLLHLDDALAVHGVEVAGRTVSFEHAAGELWLRFAEEVPAGDELVVAIGYGGQPRVARNPPWIGGFTWAKTPSGEPWIATSCQGEGADLWWPCKDHPSDETRTMDLRIRVPQGLLVASNGTLQRRDVHDDGTETFHWHVANPIANYAVALNIAPYEVLETEVESVAGGTFPVQLYVLPENVEAGEAFLAQIVDHLQWFESVCGPYPWRDEKYGVAETPFLGMEHQTIIAYGNRFRPGRYGDDYDWLHHHELAHEWWGNLVTVADWKDMWVHEGIGTYMQALYLGQRFGEDAYFREMYRNLRGLGNRRAIAPREPTDSHQIYFGGGSNDIYYKGSWVMHSLRWLLGDETFFTALRRMAYPTEEMEKITGGGQARLTSTDEIRGIVERVAGRDLQWFFDLYLHRPELPRIDVERDGDAARLRWVTPDGVPFPMPVEVVVDGEARRVEMPGGEAEIAVPAGADLRVDPRMRVLRQLARTGARRGR